MSAALELLRVLQEAGNSEALSSDCFATPAQCGASEDGGEASLWYVGVIVSIIGSVLSNLGVNTQKYSMVQEILAGRDRAYAKQPVWLLGLLMVILGAVADFGALGFAAQSLITPVGGFTMVANLFFASFWLGEKITRLDLFSTMAIIGGIVLIAAFADKSDQCYTLESLRCLYKRKQFIVYAVLTASLAALVYLSVVVLRRRLAVLVASKDTEGADYKRMNMALPLLCASLSGLIGAQSVLFAKSVIEILKSTARGNPEFSSFVTYLVIVAMFSAIFGQIHWLAVGLAQFDAVVIVPVFQSVFVTFTIVAGGAYFGEFRKFNQLQTIFFPLGVLVLIGGVLGLARHKSRSAEDLLHLNADGTLRPDKEEPADAERAPDAADAQRRRESFQRYEEFSRLAPYGAFTGGFIPLELLMNEVDRSFERVGTFLHRANSSEHFGDSAASSRRTSSPGRASGTVAADSGVAEHARDNRGSSFAVVEGFLNFTSRLKRAATLGSVGHRGSVEFDGAGAGSEATSGAEGARAGDGDRRRVAHGADDSDSEEEEVVQVRDARDLDKRR